MTVCSCWKAALAALATLVDRKAVKDAAQCVDVVAGALADKNADVQAQAHQLLVKLCALDAASVPGQGRRDLRAARQGRPQEDQGGPAKDDRAWDLVGGARCALVLAVKELGRLPARRRALEKARHTQGQARGRARRPLAKYAHGRAPSPASRVRTWHYTHAAPADVV